MSEAPLRIAIVSASLRDASLSRDAARQAQARLDSLGADTDFLDLADLDLRGYPRSEQDPELIRFSRRMDDADGWVLATPVYNFGPSGTLLTFLHHALLHHEGREFRPFVVIASIGGLRSALAADSLVTAVMNERRSVPVGPPLIVLGDDPGHADRLNGSLTALLAYASAARTLVL